jgi:ribosomal subunit interface protein
MQVQVSGKHVDVGDALRSRITQELTDNIGKIFERGGEADVVVSREGHAFRVDCTVRLASGQRLTTHGQGGDAHQAFDAALGRMVKRIRRYKHRLKDRHPRAQARQAETAGYFVIQAPDEAEAPEEPEADGADGAPEPMVIAETETELHTLTVSGAVMELDLTESQAIVFRNAAHGGLSVVYRRRDGNIGWIDPRRTGA